MKIALITDGIYPFVIGGMQKHSYYLAKFLAKNKIYVRVYHCIKSTSNYNNLLQESFTEQERKYLEFITIPFDFSSKFPGYYIYESYRYSKRIYNHLSKDIDTFDFIYSKGFTSWYLLKNRKKNIPKVGIKLHGYEMYQYAYNLKMKLQHYMLRIPAKYITQNADIVFSYGGKITEIIQNKLHVSPEKIITIPTAIDENLISNNITPVNTHIHFVFVGRYEKRKGIENLNIAIRELLNTNKKFHFSFIGNIPEVLRIKHKQIYYYNSITNYNKIKQILQQNDVLICPSYSEGMPNVIVEAMANGLTVIATDVGAVRSLVNSDTGFLVKDNLPSSLTKVMKQVIDEDRENIQQKKKAALSHIQNFTWDKVIQKVIDCIAISTR